MADTNGDIYDDMEAAGSGDISPTVELLHRNFTLEDFEAVETRFTDENGNPRVTQIATVILEGEDESRRFWLGGVRVNQQLAWAKEGEHLPLLISLGGEGTKKAPYNLERPNAGNVPADAPVTTAAKKAGATEVGRTKDPLRNFRNEDGSVQWHYFVERWQGEGLGMDQLGSVIGAISAGSLDHWFKVDKSRTITTLKEAARAGCTPAKEEVPFE